MFCVRFCLKRKLLCSRVRETYNFVLLTCAFEFVLSRMTGSVWLIIMGSGLDDWIYWHLFTITVSYNSLQSMAVGDSLHSLLDYECLLFYCDESALTHWTPIRMPYEESLATEISRAEPTFRRTEYRSPPQTVNCPSVSCHGNQCLATCCSLQLERDFWAVAEQWTSTLAPLFRPSGGAYRAVA
jgi:hypothetical protein